MRSPLEKLVEDLPDMVCLFLPDGRLTYANRAYRAQFEIAEDANLAEFSWIPLVHPEDLPRVEALIASATPAAPEVIIDTRVVAGNGTVRLTQWICRALFDESGQFLVFTAAGREVTDLRRSELDGARLSAIVADADDAIISKTLDGIITSWNRAAESMFGYTAEEAIGLPITTIIPSERLPEEAEILSRLRRGEAMTHFETERITKYGVLLPVSLSVSPMRDRSGRIIGASKVLRDNSERRRIEGNFRRTVQNLEVLYRLVDRIARATGRDEVCEAGLAAILLVSRASRASILTFDDAGVMRFTCWSGLSDGYRAAVAGHSPWKVDAVDPEPIFIEDVAAATTLGELKGVVLGEGIKAMGFVPLVDQGRLLGKFMVYHDQPHRFGSDEVQLATVVAQHVSFGLSRAAADESIGRLLVREQGARQDADLARAEAVAANRAKDDFLAMLAHELRNPLGVVVNAIALVDDSVLDAEAQRATGMVRRQAAHLAHLLDDLLDVARITRGYIALERRVLDIRTAVRHATEAQHRMLEAKGQLLTAVVPDTPVCVTGDPARLQQVLGNLIDNASKYTPAGGSIWVELEALDNEAVLRVRDNGSGIPEQSLESVFELFTQANPTLARSAGGLGIGLTMVRRLVEMHGGSVVAHSNGPDLGTEMTVRLPLSAGDARGERRETPSVPALRRRILLVEDNADGRESLCAVLRGQGHEVFAAANGRDGIEAGLEHRPDVALIDIGLPDIDGYQVARTLRAGRGPGIRLIALTGYGQADDRTRALQAGFDLHLVKPVEPRQLSAALQDLAEIGAG